MNPANHGQIDVYSMAPSAAGTFPMTLVNDITLANNDGQID